MTNTIALKNVRLSFSNIFSYEVFEGTESDKYSATLLIPKSDIKVIAAIKNSIDRAIKKAKAGKLPVTAKICFKDGDLSDRAEQQGHWTLKSTTKKRPTVIHNAANNKEHLTAEDEVIYSGCYVNAIIDSDFYCYTNYGKGVSSTLLGVQFSQDGESFEAGRVADINEFDAFDDDGTNDIEGL